MVVHKCDICGKEMGAWLKVSTFIEVDNNRSLDVSNLSPLSGSFEMCGDCFGSLIRKKESEEINEIG